MRRVYQILNFYYYIFIDEVTMSKVQVGKKVPDFKALLDNEETFKLSENKGKNLVFYFYPKDNTPGCTKEGEDFRGNYSVIKKLNTEVIGVSKDSVTSHQKFVQKFNFPFNLISDENEKVCNLFLSLIHI